MLKDMLEKDMLKNVLKSKKAIMIIVAAVAVLIAGVVYLTTRPVTLDLYDYLEYEIGGFEGRGTVSMYLDDDRLEDDIIDAALKKGKSEESILMNMFDDEIVSMKYTPKNQLKNGDKIKVTYFFNSKSLKERYGVKFKNKSDSIKVEGLEEAKTVDVFKHLDLKFTETAPKARTQPTVTVTIDGVEFTCTVTPYENLDIGDELTIECETSDSTIPVIPKETTTTMKVPDTIPHYILNPEELTAEDMGKFKNSVQVLLESNKPFEGWFSSADIFVNCIADTGNKDRIYSNDCTISNITITNDADFYAGMYSGHPEAICMLRFELDATVSEENRDDYGKVYHCYGYCYINEAIREGDTITFDGASTASCSELYTAEIDRENGIKEYDQDWYELTKYNLMLDASKKPEVAREGANQYQSN